MSKSEFKYSINSLCEVLNCILHTDIHPEHFRLAKFNKTDKQVVPTFWNVIKKLLKRPHSSVNEIKLKMLRLKFDYIQFYGLPEDMSYGSQHLLVALSYLLSLGMLDELVDEEYKNSIFNPENGDELLHTERSRASVTFEDTNEDNYDNIVKWCEGKLRQNEKFIYTYCTQVNKLTRKIQNNTFKLVNLGNIRPIEIIALYDEKECGKFLEATDEIVKMLEKHEKWLQQSPLFWRWMTSVLSQENNDSLNVEELNEFFYRHVNKAERIEYSG